MISTATLCGRPIQELTMKPISALSLLVALLGVLISGARVASNENEPNLHGEFSIVEDVLLKYTAQLPSPDEAFRQLDKEGQLNLVIDRIERAIGGSIDTAVKLNFYLADESLAKFVRERLAERFRGKSSPATSMV